MESFPVPHVRPVDAFQALRHLPCPIIFSGGKAPELQRFSYVGAAPLLHVETRGECTTIVRPSRNSTSPDLFGALTAIMEEYGTGPDRPFPFSGGLAGFLSYDLKSSIEALPPRSSDIGTAECFMGLYDPLFVYDHIEEKGFVVSRGIRNPLLNAAALRKLLGAPPRKRALSPERAPELTNLTANMTRDDYFALLERVQEYIAAGDIYQVNIAQRLSWERRGDPFALYRRLVSHDQAPFSSYMELDGYQVISNSPERFLKVRGDKIETCPIKGTRPRGRTAGEDGRLRKLLRHNPKEVAEHIMIIDLERSDLGRICATGTVAVKELMEVATLPHLHHMVSTVTGRLKEKTTLSDILKATFPGGSITGAPKIRAMEIIDELEPTPRGIYTGAIGHIDLSGDMDLAMAIRTAITTAGKLYINVGGGIVADSDTAAEYDETLLKADSFLRTLTASSLSRASA